MKPCRRNRKRIVWLVMNALDSAESAEVTRHLEACEGCRKYHLEISSVNQRLSSLRSIVECESPARTSASGRRVLWSKIARQTNDKPILPGLNWRFALPAFTAIVLSLLIFVFLVRRPATYAPAIQQNTAPTAQASAGNPLPTLGNYRAVANQSLDQLDDLLARQSTRPVPALPSFSAFSVALLSLGD